MLTKKIKIKIEIMETCKCCEKDETGDYINNPCCFDGGICDAEDKNETLSQCIHCGAEMFKENNFWFHHSQNEIPLEDRTPQR